MNASSTSGSDQVFRELLDRARKGDQEALGKLIDLFRPYLLKVADNERDDALQAKVGNSDLVQSTCFAALRTFPNFRGRTSRELLRWLRQILLYRLNDVRDRFNAGKRNIRIEIPLQTGADDSRNPGLEAQASGPPEQVVHNEERELLDQALASMPEIDRSILEMRHKDGQAFAEIARQLHMTEDAASKRWFRALQALHEKVRRLYDHSSQ